MLSALWDLLFPPRCLFCRQRLEADTILCSHCQALVQEIKACCPACGYPLPARHRGKCPGCSGQNLMFAGTCAVGLYEGRLKEAIRRFKYGGRTEMAAGFGKLMARQIAKCNWPPLEAVVPIPLHSRKLRERGFDQAALLAEAVGKELALPVRKVLQRSRDTVSQTQLSAAERRRNLEDAFSVVCGEQVTGKVLLVDDLLTTGATANNAAKALLAGGAEKIYVAVIARS